MATNNHFELINRMILSSTLCSFSSSDSMERRKKPRRKRSSWLLVAQWIDVFDTLTSVQLFGLVSFRARRECLLGSQCACETGPSVGLSGIGV